MRRVRRIRSPSTCRPASSMRPSGPPRAATSRTGASSGSTTRKRRPPWPPSTNTPWRAVEDRLQGPAGGGACRPRGTRLRADVQGAALGPVAGDNFETVPCSCSRSPSTTPRAAPSTPPCGTPCWPPGPKAWELPDRAAAVLPPDRDLRHPRRARRRRLDPLGHGQFGYPTGRGVWPNAGRSTRWRTATHGQRRRLQGARAPVAGLTGLTGPTMRW